MKRLGTLLSVAAGAALVAGAALAQQAAKPAPPPAYKVGDVLKDAKLTDLSGKEVSLLDITRGKVTVVNFFGRH